MANSQHSDAVPGVDPPRLGNYLARERPGLARGPLRAELIEGGKSNLTYDITDGHEHWVLRRPPLGHVLATAHDMSREFRVMSALHTTEVPVPATLLLCEDTDIIGAPFYLMERVEGTVYRGREQLVTIDRDQAGELSRQLIDVLAELHTIEVATVGLDDFGKPAGYLERQVRRWGRQLEASRSREVPGIDELGALLADSIPDTQRPTIVHGDYRLDNVIVADGRIAAVLDWEMSTLGDPLADVGLFCVYYDGLRGQPGSSDDVLGGLDPELGFATSRELLDRYRGRTGLDLATLDWYTAFAYYKLAVVLEGIHYRYTQGKVVGSFADPGPNVHALVAAGLDTARSSAAIVPAGGTGSGA